MSEAIMGRAVSMKLSGRLLSLRPALAFQPSALRPRPISPVLLMLVTSSASLLSSISIRESFSKITLASVILFSATTSSASLAFSFILSWTPESSLKLANALSWVPFCCCSLESDEALEERLKPPTPPSSTKFLLLGGLKPFPLFVLRSCIERVACKGGERTSDSALTLDTPESLLIAIESFGTFLMHEDAFNPLGGFFTEETLVCFMDLRD